MFDYWKVKGVPDSIIDYLRLPIKRKAALPEGYTRRSYLKSSGTQYINTGVTGGFSVDIKFSFVGTFLKIVDTIMGNENSNSPWKSTYIRILGQGGNAIQIQCLGVGAYDLGVLNTGTHRCVADFYSNKIKFNYDVSRALDITQAETEYTDYPVFLFAANSGGTAKNFSVARIYETKFWSDINHTTLIRDFVPCERDSDSVLGMYDTVNDVFYTNQGTGNFT